jgi:hypothetical protein
VSLLSQETILSLRDELSAAKAAEARLAQDLVKAQEEWNEISENHTYWCVRRQALETLLAQEDPSPAKITKFVTFGDGPGPVPEPPESLLDDEEGL